jgi:hypothetical protein
MPGTPFRKSVCAQACWLPSRLLSGFLRMRFSEDFEVQISLMHPQLLKVLDPLLKRCSGFQANRFL